MNFEGVTKRGIKHWLLIGNLFYFLKLFCQNLPYPNNLRLVWVWSLYSFWYKKSNIFTKIRQILTVWPVNFSRKKIDKYATFDRPEAVMNVLWLLLLCYLYYTDIATINTLFVKIELPWLFLFCTIVNTERKSSAWYGTNIQLTMLNLSHA